MLTPHTVVARFMSANAPMDSDARVNKALERLVEKLEISKAAMKKVFPVLLECEREAKKKPEGLEEGEIWASDWQSRKVCRTPWGPDEVGHGVCGHWEPNEDVFLPLWSAAKNRQDKYLMKLAKLIEWGIPGSPMIERTFRPSPYVEHGPVPVYKVKKFHEWYDKALIWVRTVERVIREWQKKGIHP